MPSRYPSRSSPGGDQDPGAQQPTDGYLDGNVLAGPIAEALGMDVTTASLTCASCGLVARVADERLYDPGPGLVLRCTGCTAVVARFARTPTDIWLDLRGSVSVRIPASALEHPAPGDPSAPS